MSAQANFLSTKPRTTITLELYQRITGIVQLIVIRVRIDLGVSFFDAPFDFHRIRFEKSRDESSINSPRDFKFDNAHTRVEIRRSRTVSHISISEENASDTFQFERVLSLSLSFSRNCVREFYLAEEREERKNDFSDSPFLRHARAS